MTDLLLDDREQVAVRAVIAADAVPGDLPAKDVLQRMARLIPCDALGIAVLDSAGWAVGEATGWPHRTGSDGLPSPVGPAPVGIAHRSPRGSGHGAQAVAVLSLGVRHGTCVVTLWLVRRRHDFRAHDRAVLALVAPSIERVLHAHPTWPLPPGLTGSAGLTAQERRVLHHVAQGLSNAEVADRLCVAPCTVRKHLENAYRKLGVSNRLAAVHALQVGRDERAHPEPAPSRVTASADRASRGP